MKFRTLLLPALLLLSLAACKKEDEELEYMEGSFKIEHSMPKYVNAGEKYTFSVSGIKAPDGTAVGYYFTPPITKIADTTSVYNYTVPDTLGTFSLTITAYPVESSDKYYSSPTTVSFTIVSDSGSLSGLPRSMDGGSATLYSRRYSTMKYGDSEWICSNLCYLDDSVGHPYSDCKAMQNIVGGYYTWEEAQGVCPEGWHLPSDAEWVEMLKHCGAPESLQPLEDSPSGAGNLMVRAYFNGVSMWQYYRNVSITASSFFHAIPAGYADILSGIYDFKGFCSYAAFWTSSEDEGSGVYRYINQAYDNVYVARADKDTFAASVRCVR